MKKRLFLFGLLSVFLLCCNKDKGDFASGTVINQTGCGSDHWLVSIDNPDFSRHSFLKPSLLSACMMCFNCSNSAFVRLPATLAAPGTRIRFSFVESIPSCLSRAEAPEHIRVKNLVKL